MTASDEASETGEIQTHLFGHELTEMAKPQIIAVGAIEEILRRVRTANIPAPHCFQLHRATPNFQRKS
jgi:hypothetical protein